ncbi:pleiotropic drug resistance protein 1-like protein, partial [Tanacetum coccineum]
MHKRDLQDGRLYIGALYFGLLTILFNGYNEISMTTEKLPVFYKQRNFLFYPPWAYVASSWIIRIPISFLEAGVWTILTYYVIGFDPNISRFFKQYLTLFLANQMSSGLFRFVGALGRNIIVANTLGAFAALFVFVLGGFVLSRDDVKGWWICGYWSSPMMYAMDALVVNEFLGHSWRVTLNGTTTLGKQVIIARGFFAEAYWYWIAVAALIGFILIFNLCYALSLSFLNGQLNVFRTLYKRQQYAPCYALSLSFLNGRVNQDIHGVSKIKDGYNPATWMLEVTTSAQEIALGVDFTSIYRNSELYKFSWHKRSLLPNSILAVLPYTMHSMSMEATSVILAKPPYTAVRFVVTTLVGLFLGTVFRNLGGK